MTVKTVTKTVVFTREIGDIIRNMVYERNSESSQETRKERGSKENASENRQRTQVKIVRERK